MSFPSCSGSHESAKNSIFCATVQPGLHSAQDQGDNSNEGCEDGQDSDFAPLITGSHESAKNSIFCATVQPGLHEQKQSAQDQGYVSDSAPLSGLDCRC